MKVTEFVINNMKELNAVLHFRRYDDKALGFGFHGSLSKLLEIDPIMFKRGHITYYWRCALNCRYINHSVHYKDEVANYIDVISEL